MNPILLALLKRLIPFAIAAAVVAALGATTIPVNTVQINSKPLTGSGTPADPMRPA